MKRSGRLTYHLCRLLLGGVFVFLGVGTPILAAATPALL